MLTFIRKELIHLFSSGTGLIFSFVYLLACGSMLWFFQGSYNILDAGYATLEKFFSLSPILFIVLIPALTMRLFSEEKKNGTYNLLISRPVHLSRIWLSKFLAVFLFTALVIVSTFTYAYTLYTLGNPAGNIDMNVVFISYLSLIFLSAVFVTSGLFASSLTTNQITAFFIALAINFMIYFGFDFISMVSNSGSVKILLSSLGLSYHFNRIQRGVVESTDIGILLVYFVIFFVFSLIVLSRYKKQNGIYYIIGISTVIVLFLISYFLNFRIDFTHDKRYTINDYSKNLMAQISEKDESVKINVYLEGNLNHGFQRLQNSIKDLLTDLNKYANNKIDISYINPYNLGLAAKNVTENMASRNMPGITLNEVDRNGKLSSQVIFPYAETILGKDTLTINLLKNTLGYTAEENLNQSAENLEYEFVDAMRLLSKNEVQSIAFIEGHGELSRAYVYDAEELLSKYFNVNRGQIGNNIAELDNFDVVVIAGTTGKFTEREKYILDQYVMKGGNLLLLIDGIYLSYDDLAANGQSPSMKNETGLDDLLFTYGIRIEPDLLQDSQSTSIVVQDANSSQPVTIPWYYSPLLLPSYDDVITKDIADVKAEFASRISLLNNNPSIEKKILLSTSGHSKVIPVPAMIDFDMEKIQSDPNYFTESFIPVAASLSGQFRSAFENRPVPDSLDQEGHTTLSSGNPAKIIVVGCSDIIRNELVGQGMQTQVLPMGFDRISGRQYGNRDFIVNAVNWLANDEIISLKSKTRQLNLLNKQLVYENRNTYAILNIAIPLLFMLLIIGVVNLRRRIKYTK